MSLTRNETIEILPLFIQRDLPALSEKIQKTRGLTRSAKIQVLGALARLAADPDDLGAVQTCLKVLGI